jgi:hypothetical protein
VEYQEADLPCQSDREGFYHWQAQYGPIPQLVARLVATESPVHVARVVQRIASCWGFDHAGGTIKQQIIAGIRHAVSQNWVRQQGEFLWYPSMSAADVPVRRPRPGDDLRQIGQVAPEEIAKAALWVVEDNFALEIDRLVVCTARLLGYQRRGEHVSARVKEAVNWLIKEGKAVLANGSVALPTRGR